MRGRSAERRGNHGAETGHCFGVLEGRPTGVHAGCDEDCAKPAYCNAKHNGSRSPAAACSSGNSRSVFGRRRLSQVNVQEVVAWTPPGPPNGSSVDRRATGQSLDRTSNPLVDIGRHPDRRQCIADAQSMDTIGAFTFDGARLGSSPPV